MGLCPKPHLLFFLDKKKEAKKVKTTPTSLEKLVVRRLKTLNSLRRNTSSLKQKSFLRLLHSIFRLIGRGQSKTISRNLLLHLQIIILFK